MQIKYLLLPIIFAATFANVSPIDSCEEKIFANSSAPLASTENESSVEQFEQKEKAQNMNEENCGRLPLICCPLLSAVLLHSSYLAFKRENRDAFDSSCAYSYGTIALSAGVISFTAWISLIAQDLEFIEKVPHKEMKKRFKKAGELIAKIGLAAFITTFISQYSGEDRFGQDFGRFLKDFLS